MSSRKFSVLFVLSILVLVLAACGPMATTPQAPPTSVSLTPTTAVASPTPTKTASLFPLSVTDGLGRKVEIDHAPMRIVSLAPSNSETLFAVGAGNQVVGVTKYCNYPPKACSGKEVVGGFSAKSISVEKILALKPDLVLAAGKIHQPIIDALTQQHIPVIALTARTFHDVYANIELVGRLTGHKTKANKIVAGMRSKIKTITDKTATIPKNKRLRVFWEVWDKPLMTAGPGTFIGQMIEMAGGINIFNDLKLDYPKVNSEEVIHRNPDVILGPDKHGKKLSIEQLSQRPGWKQINAIKNGRVHLVDGDVVSRSGPRLVQGLEAIAKAIYPNLYK